MYIRLVALLIIIGAVASGCGFTSRDEIFSVTDGDQPPLSVGAWECVHYSDTELSIMKVHVATAGEGDKIAFAVLSEGGQKASSVAFHKIDDNLYLIAELMEGQDTYNFKFMRVFGDRAVLLNPNPEEVFEASAKYDVDVSNFGFVFGGGELYGPETLDAKRAFLQDLGKNAFFDSVDYICTHVQN